MIERASKAKRDAEGTHVWIAAAYIPVGSARQAELAAKYGHMKVSVGQDVDVCDLLCGICRKVYWRAKDEPCPRGDDATAHLRGGTPGVRKKRGEVDAPVVDMS